MKTPDITPQAIGAFVILVITNVLILVGIDVSDARKAALAALINAVAVAAFLIHDAIVRHGRATGLGTKLPPTMRPPA